MMDMRQALLYKPRQGVSEGWSPQGFPQTGGGFRAWERASNFNNFMNNTPTGWGIQTLAPLGLGLGLAARGNNAFANNAYTTAMNSREPAVAPVANWANQASDAQAQYGGGGFSNGQGGDGGYSGGQTDEGNDTGSRGFY
jgi:hypothetical protein